MASKRRKSAAIALAFIGVAGLSLASASQLNLTSTALQAGSVVLADCQVDGAIPVTYTTAFTSPDFNVTDVKFSNISAACGNKPLQVVLSDASGVIETIDVTVPSAVLPATTVTAVAPLTTTTDVNALTRVSAIIQG